MLKRPGPLRLAKSLTGLAQSSMSLFCCFSYWLTYLCCTFFPSLFHLLSVLAASEWLVFLRRGEIRLKQTVSVSHSFCLIFIFNESKWLQNPINHKCSSETEERGGWGHVGLWFSGGLAVFLFSNTCTNYAWCGWRKLFKVVVCVVLLWHFFPHTSRLLLLALAKNGSL